MREIFLLNVYIFLLDANFFYFPDEKVINEIFNRSDKPILTAFFYLYRRVPERWSSSLRKNNTGVWQGLNSLKG